MWNIDIRSCYEAVGPDRSKGLLVFMSSQDAIKLVDSVVNQASGVVI